MPFGAVDLRRAPVRHSRWTLLIAAMFLGGCISLGKKKHTDGTPGDGAEAASAEERREKPAGLLGSLFGKETDGAEENQAEIPPSQPVPQKIPIGTIHLVHQQGGFVLIESVRMIEIPASGELMTYSDQGKPTGKLQISPERKGNFRVADIVAGHPEQGNRVMLYVMAGADGGMPSGSDPDPDALEVLE